jgi:hypothetical protein
MLNLHGQENLSPQELLKEKLNNYVSAIPWEDIYIHSDRNEYIAGEDLWFALYLFDRQKSKLSDHSSLAYFDLINPDNRQIISKRIILDKGKGHGHIKLPDTLSTGKYIIRAYTNWMKNFLPVNCFVKEVTVYNAFSERTLKGISHPYRLNNNMSDKIKSSIMDEPGVEIIIGKNENGRTEITLKSDVVFRNKNKELCYLLVQTRGVLNMVRKIDLKSDSVTLYLIDDVIIPGVNQLVIFNSELEPVSEKFIYTPVKNYKNSDLVLSDNFKTRERVSLSILNEEDYDGSGDNQSYSISAGLVTDRSGMSDIADYMVFGTEFGPLPGVFRNSRLKDISADTINRFLLNAQSNWINWNSVISGELPSLRYTAEKDNHFITGQLIEKATGIPVKGKKVFLSRPGKTATFQYSVTDSSGLFSFTLPVSNEIYDMIIQPEDIGVRSSIMFESSFAGAHRSDSYSPDTSVTVFHDLVSKLGVNFQVNRIYGLNSIADTIYPVSESKALKRFYGKPDIELTMSDYIQLPLMEEVFFELTPGVQLKRKRDSYSMTIADPASNRIYEKAPVLLIDGVVINDPAVLAALDPETVEKIDVIKDLYMVGDYIFFGIVNVITVAGDFSGTSLPENAVRLKYRVAEPVVSFSAPDYYSESSKKNRIPDFRNTLYWNPSAVKSAGKGTSIGFWTSDGTGTYEISLQGVNQKGEPVSSGRIITVIP